MIIAQPLIISLSSIQRHLQTYSKLSTFGWAHAFGIRPVYNDTIIENNSFENRTSEQYDKFNNCWLFLWFLKCFRGIPRCKVFNLGTTISSYYFGHLNIYSWYIYKYKQHYLLLAFLKRFAGITQNILCACKIWNKYENNKYEINTDQFKNYKRSCKVTYVNIFLIMILYFISLMLHSEPIRFSQNISKWLIFADHKLKGCVWSCRCCYL